MTKFERLVAEDRSSAIHESDFWKSLDSAQALLSKALPELKCPVCSNKTFIIDRDYAKEVSPQTQLFSRARPSATSYIETIAIHCSDCGLFLFFSEDELLKRAERMK